MKYGLISDLHFGVKKADDLFFDSQVRFLRDVYVPRLVELGVESLFVLGDVYDVRKSMSTKILSRTAELIPSLFACFRTHFIVGNHDMFFSTTTSTNSVSFLKYLSPNFFVHERIENCDPFVLVPWLDGKNMETLRDLVFKEDENGRKKRRFALGHFEIPGFGVPESQPDETAHVTLDELLERFELVFSGHIHSPDSRKIAGREFRYLGAPYQMTRGDRDGARGAYIFDDETGELEFVRNEVSAKFVEVKYPEMPTPETIKGNIVDVQILSTEIGDPDVDVYMEKISAMEPLYPPVFKTIRPEESVKLEIETDNRTMRDVLDEYVDLREDFTEEEKPILKAELVGLLSAHEE